MLQSTFAEGESGKRASAIDNRDGVDSLYTAGNHNNTRFDLSLSHSAPHQQCHEVDCHIHGAIAVQSLDRLRSIGLTPAIRELIDDGPLKGFLTRFLKVFGEKSSQTQRAVEAAMTELGWLDEDAGKSA